MRPGEAAVIREAATRLLAGESIRSICIDVQRARRADRRPAAQWTPQTLRRMLASARISGQREHRGEIVAHGGVAGDHHAGRDASGSVRYAARPGAAHEHRRPPLPAGPCCFVAAAAAATLVARPRADGTRRYVCARGPGFGGCGRITITAEPVEHDDRRSRPLPPRQPELAASLHGSRSDRSRCGASGRPRPNARRPSWTSSLSAYAEQLDQHAASGSPPAARSSSGCRRPASKLATLNRVDRAATATSATPASCASSGPSMPLSRQAAIIAAILDHAVIGPATPRPQHASTRPGSVSSGAA